MNEFDANFIIGIYACVINLNIRPWFVFCRYCGNCASYCECEATPYSYVSISKRQVLDVIEQYVDGGNIKSIL